MQENSGLSLITRLFNSTTIFKEKAGLVLSGNFMVDEINHIFIERTDWYATYTSYNDRAFTAIEKGEKETEKLINEKTEKFLYEFKELSTELNSLDEVKKEDSFFVVEILEKINQFMKSLEEYNLELKNHLESIKVAKTNIEYLSSGSFKTRQQENKENLNELLGFINKKIKHINLLRKNTRAIVNSQSQILPGLREKNKLSIKTEKIELLKNASFRFAITKRWKQVLELIYADEQKLKSHKDFSKFTREFVKNRKLNDLAGFLKNELLSLKKNMTSKECDEIEIISQANTYLEYNDLYRLFEYLNKHPKIGTGYLEDNHIEIDDLIGKTARMMKRELEDFIRSEFFNEALKTLELQDFYQTNYGVFKDSEKFISVVENIAIVQRKKDKFVYRKPDKQLIDQYPKLKDIFSDQPENISITNMIEAFVDDEFDEIGIEDQVKKLSFNYLDMVTEKGVKDYENYRRSKVERPKDYKTAERILKRKDELIKNISKAGYSDECIAYLKNGNLKKFMDEIKPRNDTTDALLNLKEVFGTLELLKNQGLNIDFIERYMLELKAKKEKISKHETLEDEALDVIENLKGSLQTYFTQQGVINRNEGEETLFEFPLVLTKTPVHKGFPELFLLEDSPFSKVVIDEKEMVFSKPGENDLIFSLEPRAHFIKKLEEKQKKSESVKRPIVEESTGSILGMLQSRDSEMLDSALKNLRSKKAEGEKVDFQDLIQYDESRIKEIISKYFYSLPDHKIPFEVREGLFEFVDEYLELLISKTSEKIIKRYCGENAKRESLSLEQKEMIKKYFKVMCTTRPKKPWNIDDLIKKAGLRKEEVALNLTPTKNPEFENFQEDKLNQIRNACELIKKNEKYILEELETSKNHKVELDDNSLLEEAEEGTLMPDGVSSIEVQPHEVIIHFNEGKKLYMRGGYFL